MFKNIAAIKRANIAVGHHWFDAGAMRFFNSIVEQTVVQGAEGTYFVASSRYDETTPRQYTVHIATPDGKIDTVGEFGAYTNAADAFVAIGALVAEEKATA
jgi:hypothetical protein